MTDEAALTWINYLRFVRRAEGQAAARKVFLRARKAAGCQRCSSTRQTGVPEATRPSSHHCRSSSREAGLYSWPSPPMILYSTAIERAWGIGR